MKERKKIDPGGISLLQGEVEPPGWGKRGQDTISRGKKIFGPVKQVQCKIRSTRRV